MDISIIKMLFFNYSFKNNQPIIFRKEETKYIESRSDNTDRTTLEINKLTIEDTANYTFVVSNGYTTSNKTFDRRVKG